MLRALYEQGVEYYESGRIEEAIVYLKEAVKISPEDADVQYTIGLAYYQKRNIEESIGCFQKAIQINPNDTDSRYYLAVVLYEKGKQIAEESINQYREILRL